MSDELVIKISGDIQDLTQAYEDAAKQTEGLGSTLDTVAKVSGVAFAALTAQVGLSLKAFSDAQLSSEELTNALQNQGIYTDDLKDSYKDYADQVSEVTGIEATQIEKAQAVAQTFLGQTPITKELTQAIADLAVEQGISLPEAATELGKAIGNGTGMLLRQGLQFAATDTEADRYQKTLDFVTVKAGGFAQTANDATYGVKGLETAFTESEAELGSRFAPAFTAVVHMITDFIKPANDATSATVDIKAAFIAVGLVVTGLGVALPLLAQGFLVVRAAMVALEIGVAPLLGIVAAVALLAVGVVELGLHWKEASAKIVDIVQGLVTFISGAFKGLGAVLSGAFHLDPSKIKEGLDEIAAAFKDGVSKAATAIPEETEKALVKQDAIKQKFADQAEAKRKEQESDRIALQTAEDALVQLEIEHASSDVIKAKQAEVKTLKQITTTKNDDQQALLRAEYDNEAQVTADRQAQALQQEDSFANLDLAARSELYLARRKMSDKIEAEDSAKLKATIKTEEQVDRDAYTTELKDLIAAHNKFLEEENKYGTAYAAINYAIHSNEVQGFKSATSDLVALSQSKNSTLKEIGKAASVAQITIKTAESAMNVFAGFSAIPIVGIALGLAGAAAVIAYGGEQLQTVLAAQTGGIVPGSGFGDKIPALLEPGELIAPKQSFEEVVNGVASQRAQENGSPTTETQAPYATVQLMLNDDLGKIVEAKIIERQRIGISLLKKIT